MCMGHLGGGCLRRAGAGRQLRPQHPKGGRRKLLGFGAQSLCRHLYRADGTARYTDSQHWYSSACIHPLHGSCSRWQRRISQPFIGEQSQRNQNSCNTKSVTENSLGSRCHTHLNQRVADLRLRPQRLAGRGVAGQLLKAWTPPPPKITKTESVANSQDEDLVLDE